eukprot:scaffold100754_cov45-Phaeocystis_antarctica.AAC.1
MASVGIVSMRACASFVMATRLSWVCSCVMNFWMTSFTSATPVLSWLGVGSGSGLRSGSGSVGQREGSGLGLEAGALLDLTECALVRAHDLGRGRGQG